MSVNRWSGSPGMRRFSASNYVIYFRKADRLQIVRILHGARDAEAEMR
jgi:plasmid stabilization system protein ParE